MTTSESRQKESIKLLMIKHTSPTLRFKAVNDLDGAVGANAWAPAAKRRAAAAVFIVSKCLVEEKFYELATPDTVRFDISSICVRSTAAARRGGVSRFLPACASKDPFTTKDVSYSNIIELHVE